METGLFVVVRSDRRVCVLRGDVVYGRGEFFVLRRRRGPVVKRRVLRRNTDGNVAGAGEVLPGARIESRAARLGVLHYRQLRKFGGCWGPRSDRVVHYFFNLVTSMEYCPFSSVTAFGNSRCKDFHTPAAFDALDMSEPTR